MIKSFSCESQEAQALLQSFQRTERWAKVALEKGHTSNQSNERADQVVKVADVDHFFVWEEIFQGEQK